jgi:hypothetical protein
VLEKEGVKMDTRDFITETRMVSGFNRVHLTAQHKNELIITQGDREGLTIEGPANLVPRLVTTVRHGTLSIGTGGGWLDKLSDALTTSLSRPHIRYRLDVKELVGLEISAMAWVRAATLRSGEIVIKFGGLGELRIDSLLADRLEVVQAGMGKIELSGHVAQQQVRVCGPARYNAPGLESHSAQVTVQGMGAAVVWATRELAVTIRGPGQVSYYGAPRLATSVAPMGSLVGLGGHAGLSEAAQGFAGTAR